MQYLARVTASIVSALARNMQYESRYTTAIAKNGFRRISTAARRSSFTQKYPNGSIDK